jgi:hypothetical protein
MNRSILGRRFWMAGAAALAVCVTGFGLRPTVLAAEAGAEIAAPGTFEGSPSLTLSNGSLELTVLPKGASMASIVLLDDGEKMNPLWNPVRLNRELGREAKPSSMTGHMICVDGFGPMSQEERQAGVPFNGEANAQSYEVHSRKEGSTTELTFSGKLPIAQEAFTRTVRMVQGENVVYVESQLENLLGFDRTVNWGEHATVSSPFVEPGVTVFDLSGTRGRTDPARKAGQGPPSEPGNTPSLAPDQEFTWPIAPGLDGKTIDLRLTPGNPHNGDHFGTLMDPSRDLEWATVINTKKKLILGYLFRREDFPWMHTWIADPPTLKLVRGLEFATQPFPSSHREAVTKGPIDGVPNYRWLPAKSKITTKFLMFYARVPDGFTKVDDVRMENGQIIIEDHTAHNQVRLAASLEL